MKNKSCVTHRTRHNMNPRSLIKHELRAIQHTWTEEHVDLAHKTACSQNETEHEARVSEPQHETKTQDTSAGIRTPQSNMKQGTQTRECTTRAHSKLHTHMKTGHDGKLFQVTKLLNDTRPKRQYPDRYVLKCLTTFICTYCIKISCSWLEKLKKP